MSGCQKSLNLEIRSSRKPNSRKIDQQLIVTLGKRKTRNQTMDSIVHSDPQKQLTATIVIVTRNRRDDVLRAVASALKQDFEPLEVLVYDDASEDGTAKAVAERFSGVKVVRVEKRVGSIVLRNRGFREATGDVVLPIDDDVYFTREDTVQMVVNRFADSPSLAASALRYLEANRPDRLGFMSHVPDGEQIRSFVGCACAIRRRYVLEVGGYRDTLIHQGEERDFCLRLMDRGYEIRYMECPPIIHEPSPTRDRAQLAYLGLRNTFLFDVLNVPVPEVLIRLPIDALQLLRYRVTWRVFPGRLWMVIRGLASCLLHLPKRCAVSRSTYRRFRSLPTHGPAGRPVCDAGDDGRNGG